MHAVDIAIIVIYLAAMPLIGVLIGRRQKSSSDYFVGSRSLPWWAVMLSVVATETSTLTVISTPGLVFGGAFTFLQLALGYIVGRVIAAIVLLPRYFRGNLVSAYEFLGKRFGNGLQGTASVTFVFTRLLAEGLRLFAGAIPIKVILDHYNLHVSYWHIVVVLTALTVIYAFVGGIKAVVWVDVIQWSLYVLGAIAAIIVLVTNLPSGWADQAAEAGRFHIFEFGKNILVNPWAFVAAFIGGAFLSMASHGADQLIVQRLLSCRSLKDGQRALIGSSIVVFVQFALFLVVGAMIWSFYGGKSLDQIGLASSDEAYPTYIVNELPVGLSGLLIAGILASTMGALASALNAMSSSTVADLYKRFTKHDVPDKSILRHGRMWTLIWAVVFAGFASLFTDSKDPIIQQGLGIVGYTYGALLGSFLLGIFIKKARQADAIVGFAASVVGMAFVILLLKFNYDKATDSVTGVEIHWGQATDNLKTIGTFWYTLLGVVITLVVGGLMSLRHKTRAPEPVYDDGPDGPDGPDDKDLEPAAAG